jgi:hypothetical protein
MIEWREGAATDQAKTWAKSPFGDAINNLGYPWCPAGWPRGGIDMTNQSDISGPVYGSAQYVDPRNSTGFPGGGQTNFGVPPFGVQGYVGVVTNAAPPPALSLEHQLRIEALRLAQKSDDDATYPASADGLVKRAEIYLKFLMGEKA